MNKVFSLNSQVYVGDFSKEVKSEKLDRAEIPQEVNGLIICTIQWEAISILSLSRTCTSHAHLQSRFGMNVENSCTR